MMHGFNAQPRECAVQADFVLGKPLLPFQQLLAVLPAGSRQLLPQPYQVRLCELAAS